MTETINNPNIIVEHQTEKIKLMKMSRGYQWECTILPRQEILLHTDILRLKELDAQMNEIWGAGE